MKFVGLDFNYFTLMHIVYILLCVGAVVGMYFILRKVHVKRLNTVMFALSILQCIMFMVLMVLKLIFVPNANIIDELPLNLFSLIVILMPFGLYLHHRDMLGVCYYIGSIVCGIDILFPTAQFVGLHFYNPAVIMYYIFMAFEISMCINIGLQKIYEPDKHWIPDYTLMLLFAESVMHIFNICVRFSMLSFNTNYCYTFNQEGNILFELLFKIIPFPFVYLTPLLILIVGGMYAMSIPQFIAIRRRKKQEAIEGINKMNEIAKREHELTIKVDNKNTKQTPKRIKADKVYKIRDDDKFV